MRSPTLVPPPVPSLETERLLLRGHRVEDLDDCFAMWSSPLVARHIGGRPSTREEVWWRILRYAGHWSLLGFGYWVIAERGTGRYLGEAGFADFQRDLTPSFAGAPEAGWALTPAAQGKGFATEALRAIVAWGDGHFGSQRTVCMIDPGNVASIRLATKCGYTEQVRTTYHGTPTILFERKPRGAG